MAENNYRRERNRYGFDGGLEMESMYGLPSLFEDRTKTHMSSVPQSTATAPSQQSNIANTVPEIIPNPGTGKLGTEPGGKSNAIDVSQKALTQGNIPLEKSLETGDLSTTMGGADNLANYGIEDPGAFIDQYAQEELLAEAGSPQGLSLRTSSPDLGKAAQVAVPKPDVGVLQKGKDLLGKGGDLLSKYAGPATMVMQGINSIREYGQRDKVIGSLEDSVSELQGAIGNMANEKDTALDALSDQFSEERRKIGEKRKLVLGAKLDDARQRKTGGLISGSKQELMDDITDTLQTTTDLDLARAEEGHEAQESKYIEDQRNKRADATRQLEQLSAQLEQQKKEQKWAPVEGIVDLAISGVSLANPAAGMALGMAKSGAKSMLT